MVAMEEIERLGREIGRAFRAERVILFGSHAQGTASEDSDVDLLVILPFQGSAVEQAVQMRLAVNVPFAVDLLVRTPRMVRERLAMGDAFLRDILQHGKVLYEAHQR